MDRFLFFLDGNEVPSPDGWDKFSHEFDRDEKERIISVKFSDQVTFSGAGYAAIKDRYDADGYCAAMTFEMQQECGTTLITVARGTLIVADAEWNETRCTVQVSIADNGIAAQVANNKNIPVTPISPLSKNSIAIAPVVPFELTPFHPADGTYITEHRRAFDWWDCIVHAVAYMTDGHISVTSQWYSNLPDDEHYLVAIGAELRTSGFTVPRLEYSFADLFNELAIKYDLWIFATEDANGNPVLKIEPQSHFFGITAGIAVENIQDLVRTIDTDRLYATVKVGSEEAIKELGTDNALPFIVLLGFTEELFHFTGVCNTDAELNLVNKWVIDTNVIARCIEENDDTWDDDLFLIQYVFSTKIATEGQYLFLGDYPALYNEQLLNSNVLLRYDLPSGVGANTGSIDDSFMAERTITSSVENGVSFDLTASTGSPTTPFRIRFDDDFTPPNYDTSNAWGNGTSPGTPVTLANSRFTADSQGLYVLSLKSITTISTVYPTFLGFLCFLPIVKVVYRARVFNSSDVQIGSDHLAYTSGHYYIGTFEDMVNFSISLNATDYVEIWASGVTSGIIQNSTVGLSCDPTPGAVTPGVTVINIGNGTTLSTSVIIGGGFIEPINKSRVLKFSFDRFMDIHDWQHIATIPQDGVEIDGPRLTHASNVKRTIATGEAKWTTIKRP